MDPVSLNTFFTTTRNFSKYVINQDRRLVQVPANELALDYSPNSGMRLGILVEPASTNYFPDSENLTTGVLKSSNASVTNKSIAESPKSISFPSGKTTAWVGCDTSISASYVAVTFFVTQSNLQRPKVGYGYDETASITIRFNDEEINMATSDVDIQGPMNDLSYRVRVRAFVPGGSLTNVKIYKTARQAHGLDIARIQVEPNVWTSYIPTTGTVASRAAETVYRDLTHGIDFNQDQGTFDVVYSPTPGSLGSAMTVLKTDWTEFVAVGHQFDDAGDPEALRFVSASHQFDRLSYHDTDASIRDKYSAIRFSYSGYGVRGIIANNGGRVAKLKEFDSFLNGIFDRLQFGESYDGSHFAGHIHLINIYARTFNDEEMRNLRFNVNSSSSAIDTDLEESRVSATAAAVFRTDLEATMYQNVVEPPTPERILAAWPRASTFHYYSDPETAPDNPTYDGNKISAGMWYYNATSHAFVQPVNSNFIEQIFSPIMIDHYEFEATLWADSSAPNYWNDDDYIGLIAASKHINGKLVSLIVGIHTGGFSTGVPRFSMTLLDESNTTQYDKLMATPTPHLVGGFKEGVIVGNNFFPERRTPAGGWTDQKMKIRVTRRGDFVSAVATQPNSDVYDPASELNVNIAQLPGNGELLTGPARYGFVNASNTGATYSDYNIQSDQVINDLKIYSEETGKYWRFDDGVWTLQLDTAAQDLLPATRINNRVTRESYLIDETTEVMTFDRNNGISYGEATINVPVSSTTDIPFSDILDQFDYTEELFFFNVYEEQNVIAEQVDGQLRIVSEATNGSFYVLMGTQSVTDSFGITEETIGFRKVNVVVS